MGTLDWGNEMIVYDLWAQEIASLIDGMFMPYEKRARLCECVYQLRDILRCEKANLEDLKQQISKLEGNRDEVVGQAVAFDLDARIQVYANWLLNYANSESRDQMILAAHVVRPSAGMLMMWPSPLQHYVHPNLSDEHRITISFNLAMDREAYAPVGKRGL